MIAPACNCESHSKKHGKDRNGNQRFRCKECGKTWIEDRVKPIGNMRIDPARAELALKMLLEGMAIRAVERITGLHRDTICDLILTVGENCEQFMRDVRVAPEAVTAIELDECWSFVSCHEKIRKARGYDDSQGDSWTWVAIERETKMVLALHVGKRTNKDCRTFLRQLDDSTPGAHFQVTSDGLAAYTHNVPFELGSRIEFAQLIKQYASTQVETRYAPATIIGIEKVVRFGTPDESKISTSFVERFNLSLRMHLRRFTRLTSGHSKSLAHHKAMQALFVVFYNWARKHETLKGRTPAMASGLTDHVWSMSELMEAVATHS